MFKVYLYTLICLLAISHCDAQSPLLAKSKASYQNPIISGDFADPSVIRVGDTYYAVGTSSEWGPAFPIYTSKDLVNWTYVGPVFTKLPAWTMGSFWAPELYFRNGTYYLYYTARRQSDKHSFIGVATTKDLEKGFSDHGLLLEWTSEAIDPFIIDEDGKLFITWKAYGLDKGKAIEILGAELSPNGLQVTGKAFTLLTAEPNDWEGGGAEGQALFKHGRYYYMLYSGNTCCGEQCDYQVGLARAEKLRGPWVKFAGNPVLIGSDTWKCPGHGTVVTTPDNRYFYLHHAYNGTDFTSIGRQGVLSELVWDDKSGWPSFRYGRTTPDQADSPTGKAQKKSDNLSIDFSKPSRSIPWVWDVSQPEPVFSVHQGHLNVTPSPFSPTGSFMGLIVKNGTYSFSANIRPQANVLQSICLYGDASNALGLGIRSDSLELWQIKDGERSVLKTQLIANKTNLIELTIRSKQGRFYEFGWQEAKSSPVVITDKPIDGSFLPRWDRAPRIGISVSGLPKAVSSIQSLSLQYTD